MYSSRALLACVLIAILQISLFSIPARGNETATSCCADLEALVSGLSAAFRIAH